MWWCAVALFLVNVAVLTFLWWTPMPDLTVFSGYTPKHDLKPYTPKN